MLIKQLVKPIKLPSERIVSTIINLKTLPLSNFVTGKLFYHTFIKIDIDKWNIFPYY